MNFAVILSGGKQYLVEKDQELLVDLLPSDKKKLTFEPLLVAAEKSILVGNPAVKGYKVSADLVESEVKGQKLRITKFKAKKRVNKTTGHRQKYSKIKITAIGK